MSEDVGAHLERLYEKIAHLEGMIERSHRQGTVTDVDYSDATKPRARIGIGVDDQGQPVKGPWVAIASHAGARQIHAPVSVGQQMLHLSPDGNLESGILLPYGFSKPIPSPSTDKDTHVDQLGKTKNTIKDGSWTQEVEGVSVALTKGKLSITVGGTTLVITDGKVVATSTNIALVGSVALGAENASRELALKGTLDSAGDAEESNLSTKVKGV